VKLQRLAFLAGLALFAWLIFRIGPSVIGRNLARVGWGFALVLALESVTVTFLTLGWRRTLPAGRRVPWASLAAMRLAGDAVNTLAPAAVVGGEAIRAGLLTRFLPVAESLASVGLAAMTQFLAQVLFVGLGATVAPAGSLQPRLRFLGLALLAGLFLFAVFLRRLSRRRETPPRPIGRLLERLGRTLGGSASGEDFWRDLRRNVFSAIRERPGDLVLSALFFLCGWLVSIVEVGLILRFLGIPVAPGTALSISVLLVLVEGVLFFVPARVGVLEGGLYAIFLALGLDPASGFSLGIVRRLRELVWGLVGLTILGVYRRRPESVAESLTEPRQARTSTGS
jgi:uncharacterized protein (TIRG00374 family)